MTTLRHVHHAAESKVRSGNIAPFASRKLWVSLALRLCLRTSREAGLWRLAIAAIVLVAAASTCGYVVLVLVGVPAVVAIVASWRSVLPRKAWEDPSIVHVNRLATHSRLSNYSSFDAAAARGQSPNVVSLSGTWKFSLASSVAKTPAGFQDPGFQDSSWHDINVPGHWQLQCAGAADPPIYTNTNYPFPNHPPYAPRNNPTGMYRRKFSLPAGWLAAGGDGAGGVDGLLNENFQLVERPVRSRLQGRVVICFQGVDSAFHVWVNGRLVGFAKGSRLPCEFDVTDALRGTGEQSLCLRVVRWSDGSYLEDQDHWWLSGVYREVELALRPGPSRISDLIVRPFLREDDAGGHTRGSLEVEVLVERDSPLAHASASTGRRNRGVAALTEGDGNAGSTRHPTLRRRAPFPLENVEAGRGGRLRDDGPRSALGSGEITCTLLDTATGEKFPLENAGALPDWQMGLPPADARQQQQQQQRQQQQWGTEILKESESESASESGGGDGYGDRGEGVGRGSGGGGGNVIGQFFSGLKKRCGILGGSREGELAAVIATRSVRLFRLEVPGAVRAWSAEDPQLYTLVVSLRGEGVEAEEGQEGGESLQFESTRVGFRSVRVSSGQLLVNGSAVMVAGVNRHEHDPDTGKTVSEESMRRDIVMMKRFNFNSVRNCHYPNHWRWYELCDELGLYVCDEANIESHGQIPLCRLSADPYWRLSYLERTWRMLAANKNHACIILWSLGNESGDGGNFSACRSLVKRTDPSRPVVYEGGGGSLVEGSGCTELTDVVCPMYASVGTMELLGTDGPAGVGETRPCVLCEYSHAMGNSNGNLHKYWEIFRSHRRLQGGFIWDWVDQGITQCDVSTGRKYWADGRSFDGRHSEGYDAFCVNGVTFPDRSPHPALWEAKFLAQPVGIELVRRGHRPPSAPPPALLPPSPPPPLQPPSWSAPSSSPPFLGPVCPGGGQGTISVALLFTNRYDFLSLDHLSIAWRLKSAAAPPGGGEGAGSPLAVGEVRLFDLAPGASRELVIDTALGDGGGGGGGGGGGAGGVGGVGSDIGSGSAGGEGGVGDERGLAAEERARDGDGDGPGLGNRGELFVHVEARLRTGSPWAPEGHLVAWGCFPVAEHISTEKAPLQLLLNPPRRSCTSAEGPFPALADGEGGAGAGEAVVAPATVPRSPPTLVVYEDEVDSSAPSGEGSPMGQLREQLLTDSPTRPLASSLIVVKGLLNRRGVLGVARGETGAAYCPPTEWMLVVSKLEGTLVRFVAGGVDLIEPDTGPSLCLWRAATDNDKAGWLTLLNFVIDHRVSGFLSNFLPLSRLSHLQRWKASGLSATEPPVLETQDVVVAKPNDQECIITVKSRCMARRGRRVLFGVTTEMRLSAQARLEITTHVEPLQQALHDCLSLARVGMLLKLPPGFGHVEWFGKGPFECYQDRKHGATTDVFSGTVEGQHVPYISPSENGGKADVRWMALRRGEGGAGVLMQAEKGTVFEAASCSLYSAAELQKAERTVDLPLRTSAEDPVYVHLDHRSMGVGGDNSWYPNVVHEEYTVPAKKAYSFRVRLEALAPGHAAPTAALAPPTRTSDR